MEFFINFAKIQILRFKNLINTAPLSPSLTHFNMIPGKRLNEALLIHHRSLNVRFHKKHTKKRILKLVKLQKSHIEQLAINFASCYVAMKLVMQIENLKSLEISNITKKASKPFDKVKINLPNLKTLKTSFAGNFLKHIGEHKVEELTMGHDSMDTTEINEFLRTCKTLKKLTLDSFFPDVEIEPIYQLEFLKIVNFLRYHEDKLMNLMESHRESLKVLHLNDVSFTVARFVVSELKVEEFRVNLTGLPVIEDLKDNFSIKRLFIDIDYEVHKESSHMILESCKGVEKLQILTNKPTVYRETLKVASINMENLTNLTLKMAPFNYKAVTFENLEVLEIEKVTRDEHKLWISLAVLCPKLKIIKITQLMDLKMENYAIPSNDIKNLLEMCKNLEELYIGPHFDISDEFMETLLRYKSNKYWYLRIKSCEFEKDAERVKKFNCLRLRCEVVRAKCEINKFYVGNVKTVNLTPQKNFFEKIFNKIYAQKV